MEYLINALSFFIGMGILISIHEASHFFVGKLCGIKILKFSIGIPIGNTPIFRKIGRDGTIYEFNWFLLGGFVDFLDTRKHNKEDDKLKNLSSDEWHRAFNLQPLWKRYITVLAGPTSNIILFFIISVFFTFIDGTKGVPPIISDVAPNSWAYSQKFEPEDKITAVGNMKINTITDLIKAYKYYEGELVNVEVINPKTASTKSNLSVEITQKMSPHREKSFEKLTGLTFDLSFFTNEISYIEENSLIFNKGGELGDIIRIANNKKISNAFEFISLKNAFMDSEESQLEITLYNGLRDKTIVISKQDLIASNGMLGISFKIDDSLIYNKKYSFSEAINYTLLKTKDNSFFILKILGRLISGEEDFKDSISGPFTISKVLGSGVNKGINDFKHNVQKDNFTALIDSLNISLKEFLRILSFLSLSLGIMNLLPIPTLDGGHLLMYKIEMIIRRPIPQKMEMYIYSIGALIVVSFMIFSIIIDISKYL